MSKQQGKRSIYAYGFDKAGFVTPSDLVEAEFFSIRFLGFETEQTFDGADGIVIPSGIFENFEAHNRGYGESHTSVYCAEDKLAVREKQVFQSYRRGSWICFLLQAVNNGTYDQDWRGSDLAKKFLNYFFKEVHCHGPNPHVHCKADEFIKYFDRYGINRTTFRDPRENHTPRILAGEKAAIIAAELSGQFFFLPLPSKGNERSEARNIVTLCTEAILEYKKRNDIYLPPWVESIRFNTELLITDQLTAIEKERIQLEEDLSKWHDYKGILSASGRTLNELVVKVLRGFFNLELQSEEQYVEDAIIVDGEKKPLFVVEIKGVNGGLKREHVNQVDSHRERLGFSDEVPGLLILNDFMDLDALAERKKKTFDDLHLSHAEKQNVKILRTTTLIELMMMDEENPGRKEHFLQLCSDAKPLVRLPSSPASDPAPPIHG